MLIPRLRMGGAEVQVLSLVEHLDKSQFAVSLVCLNSGAEEMEALARPHVDSFATLDFHWRYFPFSFARLIGRLRRGSFDVVHCHLPLADVLGRAAGWLAGVPIRVTTEHGKFLGKPWYHLALEWMLLPITDARICVSTDIVEIRRRREGTPERKLVYIPNGVDAARFRNPRRTRGEVMAELGWETSRPFVLSVGRLEPEKNYELLVWAIDRLRGGLPGVACLLVGEGSRRRDLERLIDSLDLGSSVKLAGPRSDIPDLLAAADVFVLSSLREGLPVSLLEAMAAGRAIVATSVGGISDALRPGENGMLVPSGDVDKLAEALGMVLGDEALRLRLGRAAAADVDRTYRIETIAARTGALYRELFDGKAAMRNRP
jgi:glycosyltransferase involved in cell wall biosynthesis